MKTIKLYGDMGKRFGRNHKLDVATPAEAIRALCILRPGFRSYLQDRLESPFRVLVGKEAQDADGLRAPVGCSETIKIVPLVSGSKDGLTSILMGAALIAAVYFTGGMAGAGFSMIGTTWMSNVAISVGMSMVLTGASSLLSKPPNTNTNGGSNDAPTWSFGSPTLTQGQGGCVPLGFGTMQIGGCIISAGLDSHTYQSKGFGGAAPDDAGTRGGNGDTEPWVWAIEPKVV